MNEQISDFDIDTDIFVAVPHISLKQLERDYSLHVLHANAGDVTAAALILGLKPEKLKARVLAYQAQSKRTQARKSTSANQIGKWIPQHLGWLSELYGEGLRAEAIHALPDFAALTPRAIRRKATSLGLQEPKKPRSTPTRKQRSSDETQIDKRSTWAVFDETIGQTHDQLLTELRALNLTTPQIAEHPGFKNFTTRAAIQQRISKLKLARPKREKLDQPRPAKQQSRQSVRKPGKWAEKDALLKRLCHAGKTPAEIHAMDEFRGFCSLKNLTAHIYARQLPTNSRRMQNALERSEQMRASAQEQHPKNYKSTQPSVYREPRKLAAWQPSTPTQHSRPQDSASTAGNPAAVVKIKGSVLAHLAQAAQAAQSVIVTQLNGQITRRVTILPNGKLDDQHNRFEQLRQEFLNQKFALVEGDDACCSFWHADGIYGEVMRRPNETVAKLAAQIVGLDGRQPRLPTGARGLEVSGFRADCASLNGPCEIAALTLPISGQSGSVAGGLYCLDDLIDSNAIFKKWAVPPGFGSFMGLQFSDRNPNLDQTPAALRPFCRPDAAASFSKR